MFGKKNIGSQKMLVPYSQLSVVGTSVGLSCDKLMPIISNGSKLE